MRAINAGFYGVYQHKQAVADPEIFHANLTPQFSRVSYARIITNFKNNYCAVMKIE